MGVYIKNMEMPKSCCQCPVNMEVCKRGYEYLLKHSELYDKRADDCPIVEIPPHGRLIDKDVMCNECRRIAEEYDGIYPDCTYCPAHLAPTIIEAEEGET